MGKRGIILQSFARSGTHFLCSMSNQSGIMGDEQEWLNASHGFSAEFTGAADTYFDAVINRASTENDRFMVKVFPRELMQISYKFGFDFIEKCRQLHDVRFVRLSRRDVVAQTISLERAMHDGQWQDYGDQKPRPPFDLDMQRLANSVRDVAAGSAFWDAYNAATGIRPLELVYETVCDDPNNALDALADLLAVAKPADGWPQPKTRIQRDTGSQQLIERFHAWLSKNPTAKLMSREEIGMADQHVRSSNASQRMGYQHAAPRTLRNLYRFLQKQPLI